MPRPVEGPEGFRAGYVALIGRPNAGKSTLLNALLGQKLSIVSPKPQTTRHRILGILTTKECQILFTDTPGVMEPRYELQDAMMKSVRSAAHDADVVIYLEDASEPPARSVENKDPLPGILNSVSCPVVHALNKTDIAAGGGVKQGDRHAPFGPPIRISALKQTGLEILMNAVVAALPIHPPYYDEETLTDRDERFFVCEIVREKIFDAYREEIPYSTTVQIAEFKEQSKKDLIRVEIIVERESQKGIIIGGKGQALKLVGERARIDIEKLLERPVFLELRVKVREKWRDTPAWVKRFGYTQQG